MKPEIGTLVEIKLNNSPDDSNKDKMAIVKIDQAHHIIVLEDQQTGEKVEMTFDYFTHSTGIQMDNRTLLRG